MSGIKEWMNSLQVLKVLGIDNPELTMDDIDFFKTHSVLLAKMSHTKAYLTSLEVLRLYAARQKMKG